MGMAWRDFARVFHGLDTAPETGETPEFAGTITHLSVSGA